jgi:hypothetical protein
MKSPEYDQSRSLLILPHEAGMTGEGKISMVRANRSSAAAFAVSDQRNIDP